MTDDLQVHLLELTKLPVKRENLAAATPVEKWAFFLVNAENMTMADIRELFPEPEIVEAAGVLEVIKNNPDQMDNYISRLKFQLDEISRLESTRLEALAEGRTEGLLEGRQEGRQEGELIGRIEMLQEILGIQEPKREVLLGFGVAQLTDLAEHLRQQLRSRTVE